MLYAIQAFFILPTTPNTVAARKPSPAPVRPTSNDALKKQASRSDTVSGKAANDVAAPASRTPTMLVVINVLPTQLFLLENESHSESRAVELCLGGARVNYAIDASAKQAATVLIDDLEINVVQPSRGADDLPVPLIRSFDAKLDYVRWRAQPRDPLEKQVK